MIKYAIIGSLLLINLTGCYENKINNNSINSRVLERSMEAQAEAFASFHETLTLTESMMIEQCNKDQKICHELAKDSEVLVKALDVAVVRL